ncbi:hypothetical protein F5X99DRAFT_377310 [Biscogniauxia marginata]|nr:hypothetical protein F5X99DRAFT_377310 [Biscogniauxia marginata]
MSKQGGDLNEMAKDGTSVPGDAGKQNVVPSVPDPQQKRDPSPGATALHSAADNPVGVGPADDEAVTASGHEVPAAAAAEKYSRSGGKERNH